MKAPNHINGMNNGTDHDSKHFKPGFNNFTSTGPVCISYIDRESGGLVTTFIVDLGYSRLRVPSHCRVDVDAHDSVQWFVHKNSPHEITETTPVEIPVASAKTMRDEIRDMAQSIIAERLNVAKEDVELPEDFADFAVDDEDHIPMTRHELQIMREDQEALLRAQQPPPTPPGEPSSSVDETAEFESSAVQIGKNRAKAKAKPKPPASEEVDDSA